MTEITVLDNVGNVGSHTLTKEEYLLLFDKIHDQIIKTTQISGWDVIADTSIRLLEKPVDHPIDSDQIAGSPADIALRELLRILRPDDIVQLVPIGESINALPKLGAAAIRLFRPFARQGLPARPVTNKTVPSTAPVEDTVNHTIYPSKSTPYIIIAADGSYDAYVAAPQTALVVRGLQLQPSHDRRVSAYTIGTGTSSILVGGEVHDLFDLRPEISANIANRIDILRRWSTWEQGGQRWRVDYASREWADLSATGTRETKRLIIAQRRGAIVFDRAPDPMETTEDTPFMQMAEGHFGRITRLQPNLTGEIASYGIMPAYISSLYTGADSKQTRSLFDEQVEIRSNLIAAALAHKAKLAERERFDARMYILSRVLSPTRYNIVSRADNDTKLAKLLTPAEAETLNAEYDAELRYAEASLNNKCDHIPLYKTFRRAVSFSDKKTAWEALAKYVSRHDSKGAGKSGAPSMYVCNNCGFPLVCPHYIEYVRLTVSGASARAVRDALSKYVMDGSRAEAQKCRICYEIMFSRFDLSDDITADDSYNDDIRRAVYIEASQFMQYVRFKNPVDLPGLISQLRDVVYPYAVRIDIDLKKMQNITSSDVALQRNAYTAMIVAAKIVQLIAKSRGEIFFEAAPKLKGLRDLTDYAAGVISSTKTTVLRDIAGITRTVIRDRIALGIEAFGDNIDVKPESQTYESPEDFAQRLIHDPTYAWIANATGRTKFAQIMGASPAELYEKIKSGQSIYALARDGPILYKSPYITELFKDHMQIAKKGETRVRVESIGGTSVVKKYARLEHEWDVPRRRAALRLASTPGGTAQFRDHPPPIGTVYDENGTLHEWTLYNIGDSVYTADGLASIGRDAAKLAEIAPGGIRAAITDRTCSVCGVRESLAGKLDAGRVRAGISAVVDITSFYRFYDQRCPAGEMHDMTAGDGNTCKKCGLVLRWKSDTGGADSLNYYRKYRDTFEEERRQLSASVTRQEPLAATVDSSEPVEWTEHFADVTAVAEIGGVHPRVIYAFGAYEGTSVDNIANGSYTPMHTTRRDDTRVLAVNAIVRCMLSAWDRIRNYNVIKTHTQYTIDTIGKTPRSLLDGLPDVATGYDALYRHSYWNKPAEKTIELCIQEWCSRLLRIYNDTNEDTRALRHLFVKTQIKNTIAGQELYTERQPFNWAIMYGRKDAPDVIEDFDPNEESITRDKLFSVDAFDMEGGEVNLRIGEDAG